MCFIVLPIELPVDLPMDIGLPIGLTIAYWIACYCCYCWLEFGLGAWVAVRVGWLSSQLSPAELFIFVGCIYVM